MLCHSHHVQPWLALTTQAADAALYSAQTGSLPAATLTPAPPGVLPLPAFTPVPAPRPSPSSILTFLKPDANRRAAAAGSQTSAAGNGRYDLRRNRAALIFILCAFFLDELPGHQSGRSNQHVVFDSGA